MEYYPEPAWNSVQRTCPERFVSGLFLSEYKHTIAGAGLALAVVARQGESPFSSVAEPPELPDYRGSTGTPIKTGGTGDDGYEPVPPCREGRVTMPLPPWRRRAYANHNLPAKAQCVDASGMRRQGQSRAWFRTRVPQDPTMLFAGRGPDLAGSFSKAERAVGDRQLRPHVEPAPL
jgi:hypothetical protein